MLRGGGGVKMPRPAVLPSGPVDATTRAVPVPVRSSSTLPRGRPMRAGMAGAILALWVAFVIALSLIRVVEQVTRTGTALGPGSASGVYAPSGWVPVAVAWLYLAALACVSVALVLAILSAARWGRGSWVATLLLLDGPFVFLLANTLLGGPVGG